ncbi:hypothetical protein [Dactylosporangium sp. NPDC051541]|uniref:hypothetical protein n=1 Tax=Dactylosporangium sp. NPDC051541 TaxID=3363977 RepID=UPI00379E1802
MTAAPKGALAVRFAAPLLLLVSVFAVLWFYRVPPLTTAIFLVYLALGITLPGTLWWRLGRGRSEWLVGDLAAGLAVGYIGEVFCYVIARLLGAPLLVLVFPLATVALFALIPAWRPHFRPDLSPERPSLPFQWVLTALAGLTLVWSIKFFRVYGLQYPANASPDTDSPFHLALLGEAKHHMPLTIPWIQGEPLLYHWFVYPEMAATSWVTGIEPNVLLLRLSMLPMLMAFTALIAMLGRRVIGNWWAGAAASAVTLLVLAPNPYQWQLNAFYRDLAFSGFDDGAYLRQTAWTGPTQTFGALLFVPVMLVLVDLLHGSRRQWVLFAVLLAGVTGAKATYLPLLAAGLGLLIVVRRFHRVALLALGGTVLAFLAGMLLLFGASSQGTRLAPLTDVATGGIGATTGFSAGREPWNLLVLAFLTVLCWAAMWAGIALLRRPSPELVVMLGMGLAGAAATMLLGQDGDSQRYFLESARPYLCIAAVAGLARFNGRILIAWSVAGIVVIQAVQTLGRNDIPREAPLLDLVLPYGILLVVLGAVWLVSKYPPLRNGYFGHIMIFGLLLGFGVNTSVQHFLLIASESRQSGFRDVVRTPRYISPGTLEAGRWLRDHSSPNDLVATNAHCLTFQGQCSNLHFSMTAYSERRMLVEGWGFATTAHEEAARLGTWVGAVPYWKPAVLAANDAVFADPSATNVDVLRDRYRVRWLFVDETQSSVSPRLADFASIRYRSGVCVVYELPRP